MRIAMVGALAIGCVLSGCSQETATAPSGSSKPGRYAGIGTFEAGRLWAEMAAAVPADPAVARLEDDEHIIVVVDSHTGEVRQCGDHSGFCVAMNPWTGDASRAVTPVKLKKHAAELTEQDRVESEAAVTNEVTSE